MSLFISLEGCEGAGKTIQADLLKTRLVEAGYSVDLIREPGTTKLGHYLRNWLKDENREKLWPEGELFLFAAARSSVVRERIRPFLKGSRAVVIADRYIDSTTAYQGYGRRISLGDIEVVNQRATGGLYPDITVLLDVPVADGLRRAGSAQFELEMGQLAESARRTGVEGTHRFEEESVEFHERVRRGYRKIADQDPERIVVVDALRPIPEVADIIFAAVDPKLPTGSAQASREDNSLPLWNTAENASVAETA